MRELAEEGYLDRRRKSGTRVRAAPMRHARFEIPLTRDEVEARGALYRYALISRAASVAPDWLRARLGLKPGTRCLHVTCLHSADGQPFQHEDRWINLQRLAAAEDADFSSRSPNEWLVETVPFSDVELSFSAVAAEPVIADHLGCSAGSPLFQMERATWLDSAPVTFVQLTYAPRYRLTTRY
jgi:GntR family histidine utilization transcriptional repressor